MLTHTGLDVKRDRSAPGQNEKSSILVPSETHANFVAGATVAPVPGHVMRAHVALQPRFYLLHTCDPIQLCVFAIRPGHSRRMIKPREIDQHQHAVFTSCLVQLLQCSHTERRFNRSITLLRCSSNSSRLRLMLRGLVVGETM